MARLKELHRFGQSPWLDGVERDLLLSGRLKQLIDEAGITGVAIEPAVLEKSVSNNSTYDAEIERLAKQGLAAQQIYEELAVWDAVKAADLLLETYQSNAGHDGFVSIGIRPDLANDAEQTVAEAKRLYTKIGRANIMIKVPATSAGIEATRRLTELGLNVNVTLIFSQAQYTASAEAYIRGIEERLERGAVVDRINSAAGFFISFIDLYIDRNLNDLMIRESDETRRQEQERLLGRAAVAQAKVIYAQYKTLFHAPQFLRLRDKGANIQRMMLSSTSTKNPEYSDVKYVEELIGNGTVSVMSQKTMTAFNDHGRVAETLNQDFSEAKRILASLKEFGISSEDICQRVGEAVYAIQDDALQALIGSYNRTVRSIDKKCQ
ncbi:MAG: transaldolase [Candidatus Saganbacteria bacterium]|nr:transaldolase [Candidatus Saganbacteria bacterium]